MQNITKYVKGCHGNNRPSQNQWKMFEVCKAVASAYFSGCKQFIFTLGTYSYQWIDRWTNINCITSSNNLFTHRPRKVDWHHCQTSSRTLRMQHVLRMRRTVHAAQFHEPARSLDLDFYLFARKITENLKQSPIKSPNVHFEINMHLKISPNTNCRAVEIRSLLRT